MISMAFLIRVMKEMVMLFDIDKKNDRFIGVVSFDCHLNGWRSTKEINEVYLWVGLGRYLERELLKL